MTKISSLALAGLLAFTGMAFAASTNGLILRGHQPRPDVPPGVSCIVQGTPSEFPHDIAITNRSPGIIAAGSTIHWAVEDKNGTFKLAGDVAAGKGFYIRNILPDGAQAGTQCAAAVS
jgi:hypothetical protein